jgi:uncharacterized repeat protein (TIGR01451 family)
LPVNVTAAAVPGGSGPSASVVNNASVGGGGDPFDGGNAPAPGSSCTTLDPADPGHCASTTTTVNEPQLSVTKTATPNPFVVGQPASYAITVTNNGTAATNANIVVTDTLPAGITDNTTSGTGWTCMGTTALTCTYSGTALAAGGGSTTLTLNVSVGVSATTGDNTANVTGGGDPNCVVATPCPGTVSVGVTVPALGVSKTSNGPWVVNQTSPAPIYTLTVTNSGSAMTSGTVTVLDVLPIGITAPATFASGAWNCSTSGQTVTCTSGAALAAINGTSQITMPVTVDASAVGVVENDASVGGGGDPNNGGVPPAPGSCVVGDAHCGSTTTAVDSPDLTIVKKGPAQIYAGNSVAYTITVSNIGNADATNVMLADPTPPGLTFVSAAAPCSGGFPCALGTLGHPASISIAVTYTVGSAVTGTLTNVATVSSDQTAQSSSSASTVVSDKPIPTPVDARWALMTLLGLLLAMGAWRLRSAA